MRKQDRQRLASRSAGGLALGLALTVWAGAPPGRYTVTTDTVLDTVTTLTWQRSVPATYYSQAAAATYCSSLNLGGTGWRLPSVKELRSLVDIRASDPAIDKVAFPNTPAERFWSSSVDAYGSSYGWLVNFFKGETSNTNTTSDPSRVRCVR